MTTNSERPEGNEQVELDETYTAKRLHLSYIPGTVEVRVGESDQVQVRIPETLVEQIRREVRWGVLHISGPHHGGGGVTGISDGPGHAQTDVSRRGGKMVISQTVVDASDVEVVGISGFDAGSISIGGDATSIESGDVQIVVNVPKGMPIRVDDRFAGKYRIGDAVGPLYMRMRSGRDGIASRMTSALLTIRWWLRR